MFRVVPDQLRISEGWVRCGQCDEVFDANAHLQILEPQRPAPTEAHVPATPQEQAALPAAQPGVEEAYDWGALLGPASPTPRASATQAEASHASACEEPLPEEQALGDAPSTAGDATPDDHGQSHALDVDALDGMRASTETPDPDCAPEPVDEWGGQTPLDNPAQADAAPPLEAADVPSFMSLRPGQSRLGRYLSAGVMGAVCLFLASSLALQYVLQERNLLAAGNPAWRQVLTAGCGLLGCALSAPRQIEFIAIDSSTFTSVKPGVYNLRLSLRNAAAIDLSAPALELTLTDMQDHALVRRVLLPTEYSGKQLIAAGAELVASVPIAVQAGNMSEKIAGYKLLAFYP